jgi:hypothetical protein
LVFGWHFPVWLIVIVSFLAGALGGSFVGELIKALRDLVVWVAGLVPHRWQPNITLTMPNDRGPLLLTVTNKGRRTKLSAQCRIVDSAHNANQYQKAPFWLPWRDTVEHVANFSLVQLPDGDRMGELELCQWTAAGPSRHDWARWFPGDGLPLPTFDLEVTIFDPKAFRPLVVKFRLSLMSRWGQLQLASLQ